MSWIVPSPRPDHTSRGETIVAIARVDNVTPRNIMSLFRRTAIVDADLIPVSSSLPVLDGGTYVWPVGRMLLGELQPTGTRFYSEGDCTTCSRCGVGNSTIAPYCVRCRALLPLGSKHPEGFDDEALMHELPIAV
jgi:hypothetical protein